MIKHLFSLICACAVAIFATAQTRPVISAYTFEVGSSHMADTYLTPLRYSGWHTALHYERMQAMKFNPENWVMQLDFQINGNRGENYSGIGLWHADIDARWSMMRRWRPISTAPSLTLGIGPGTELNLGALYLKRNGNNPVAAKGAWTLNAAAYAAYNLKLGKLPVTLRYEASLPSLGVFFAPDYGQLYYEIWLGNSEHLAHVAWWGNYFNLDNYLTADLHFGGTTLRLGYRNEIFSSKVSGIVSERVTHAFTIGITTEWLTLNTHRKTAQNDKIISALY